MPGTWATLTAPMAIRNGWACAIAELRRSKIRLPSVLQVKLFTDDLAVATANELGDDKSRFSMFSLREFVCKLRMNVLGEPFSRQLAANFARASFVIDAFGHRAELQTLPDVVDECRGLFVIFAPFDLTGKQVGQLLQPAPKLAVAVVPPAAGRLRGFYRIQRHELRPRGRWVFGKQESAIHRFEKRLVHLLYFYGAIVHAGAQPFFFVHGLHGVGAGNYDIGLLNRGLRGIDCDELRFDAALQLAAKLFTVCRIGAENFDGLDGPSRAVRHQLPTGLPAGAEERHQPGIFARQITRRESVGGPDAQARDVAVGGNHQRFAGRHAVKYDHAGPAPGAGRQAVAPDVARDRRPNQNVAVDAQCRDAGLGPEPAHGFQTVGRLRFAACGRRQGVNARAAERLSGSHRELRLFHGIEHHGNIEHGINFFVA